MRVSNAWDIPEHGLIIGMRFWNWKVGYDSNLLSLQNKIRRERAL